MEDQSTTHSEYDLPQSHEAESGRVSETLSPQERSQEAVRKLTREFNEFLPNIIDNLFDDTEAGQRLSGQLTAGRFDGTSSQAWNSVGVQGEEARVVYGDPMPFGNLEGSLYTRFGNDTLRVRWAGDLAMYLNGGENYMKIDKDRMTGDYTLRPGRIEGRRILGIAEEGVETEDPETYHQYRVEKWEYDHKLAEQREANKGLARLQRIFGKGQPTEQLVEPQAPPPIIVPHEKFIGMIDTMRKGLQKTTVTLSQAKGKL